MTRFAKWELVRREHPYPPDHDSVGGRRWVFVYYDWEHPGKAAGWHRLFELQDPTPCRKCRGPRSWSADGSRAFCHACDLRRQRRRRAIRRVTLAIERVMWHELPIDYPFESARTKMIVARAAKTVVEWEERSGNELSRFWIHPKLSRDLRELLRAHGVPVDRSPFPGDR